jgi:O-antigen ligase
MLIVILIDLIIVGTLVAVTATKGLERALPYFVFFAVLLPQESRIVLSGLFDLSSTRIALVTLLALFFVYRKKAKIRKNPLKNLMYVHIAWVTVSLTFSIVFMTSAKQLLAQVAEYYLLYFLMLKTITDLRTITRICYAMVAAMSVCSIFGLLEIYAQWSVLSIFPAELQLKYGGGNTLYAEMFDRGVRARSTFPHPIHFGGALAMTIPIVFYLLSFAKGWKRHFLSCSLLLMFLALYKTSSRGPWLAAAGAIGILVIAAQPKIRKRVITVGLVACAILILRPGITETLINMYAATLDSHSMMGSSFEYRPVLLHTVIKTLNENPERAILGYGLGSFREKGLILEIPGIETHRWYTCDSTWILFAYETGYVGFIVLATILVKPAMMALRSSRKLPKADRSFGVVSFSSMAAAYTVMISVAIYGWGQNGYMLWTVISMSIAYTSLKKDLMRRGEGASTVRDSDGCAETTAQWPTTGGRNSWEIGCDAEQQLLATPKWH